MSHASTEQTESLTITRHFPVPPEQVFDAWVNPQTRMLWWAAQPDMTCDQCEINATPGGHFRINMKSPDQTQEYVVGGTFLEVDRPHKLTMTWAWETDETDPLKQDDKDPQGQAELIQAQSQALNKQRPACENPDETLLSLTFKATQTGTEMTLTHTRFLTAWQRDEHHNGWEGCLAQLRTWLDSNH